MFLDESKNHKIEIIKIARKAFCLGKFLFLNIISKICKNVNFKRQKN